MHIEMGSMKCETGGCKCPHHKIVPLFIVLIGLVFLLEALHLVTVATTDIVWPFLLILIGLMKMFGGMCGCCNSGK